MYDLLLLALLLAAVAIGWWLGRRERQATDDQPGQHMLSRDYFVGLNYLLNEQPDRAIETFVAALEVNSDTIETHIALGNLFRSRGEADRAVKVHQNLLARPALTPAQGSLVQIELARDFLNLGLLDRAEKLLENLIHESSDDSQRQQAKLLLVDLLEREKEWQAALDVSQPGLIRQYDNIKRAAAHWLCELAERDLDSASPSLARKKLRQALNIDHHCIRATLLLARMEHDTGHYKAELKLLKRIPGQDPGSAALILEPLRDAYRLLNDEEGLEKALKEMNEKVPMTATVIMLAESVQRRAGHLEAADLLQEEMARTPSLRGLDYLIHLYRQNASSEEQRVLAPLNEHTRTLLDARPRFRCGQCGFSGTELHWQCPSCRQWGTTRPVMGRKSD
ncbi:lipopolysaccharide assembly protein LapB [Onishia niordana]|uniref:lipopolysaccharide assembly protein LapB n=1 Tax=Onishia niordana TaxID=2508711 RepID=UPI00109FCCD6|nr:lipopolysaccharide assembly protein LapB [Halomonas niordiana]